MTLKDDLWREKLTPDQFRVLREHGTEHRGSSPLNKEKREGVYVCAACERRLFTSATKYESGSGWPSFWAAEDDAVEITVDRSHGMTRTEVHCAGCGGHLGHVFPDGPQPSGERYCMNGVAMEFKEASGSGLQASGATDSGLQASGATDSRLQDPGATGSGLQAPGKEEER